MKVDDVLQNSHSLCFYKEEVAEGKGYLQLITESLAAFVNSLLSLAMKAVAPIDSFNPIIYHLSACCLLCA